MVLKLALVCILAFQMSLCLSFKLSNEIDFEELKNNPDVKNILNNFVSKIDDIDRKNTTKFIPVSPTQDDDPIETETLIDSLIKLPLWSKFPIGIKSVSIIEFADDEAKKNETENKEKNHRNKRFALNHMNPFGNNGQRPPVQQAPQFSTSLQYQPKFQPSYSSRYSAFYSGQQQQQQQLPPQQPHYVPPQQPHYVPPQQPHYVPPQQPHYVPPQQPHYVPPQQPHYVPPQQPHYVQPQQPHYVPPQQPQFAPEQTQYVPPEQTQYVPPQPQFAPEQTQYVSPQQQEYEQPQYVPPQQPHYVPPQQPHYVQPQQPHYVPPQQPHYVPPQQPHYVPSQQQFAPQEQYEQPQFAPQQQEYEQPQYVPPQQPHYVPPQQPHYVPPQQPHYVQPQQPHYVPPQQPHYVQPQQPHYVQPQQPHYVQPQQPHYVPPQQQFAPQEQYEQPQFAPQQQLAPAHALGPVLPSLPLAPSLPFPFLPVSIMLSGKQQPSQTQGSVASDMHQQPMLSASAQQAYAPITQRDPAYDLPNTCSVGLVQPIWEENQITETYCRCPDGGYGYNCQEGFKNPCNGYGQYYSADHRVPNNYFIECSLGTPYLMKCAKGTVWNQNLLTCDWTADASNETNGAYSNNQPTQSYSHSVASTAPVSQHSGGY